MPLLPAANTLVRSISAPIVMVLSVTPGPFAPPPPEEFCSSALPQPAARASVTQTVAINGLFIEPAPSSGLVRLLLREGKWPDRRTRGRRDGRTPGAEDGRVPPARRGRRAGRG